MLSRFHHGLVFPGLLFCISGAWAQSSTPQPVNAKGIDPALITKARDGNVDAEFQVAMQYENGDGVAQDNKQAAYWFGKASERGNARAEYFLGVAYLYGHGVPQDTAKGLTWLNRAAVQGHQSAQTDLAHIYLRGEFVPQDYAKAAQWYRTAAENGNPDGQAGLASLYELGEGVPKSYSDAYFWMSLAAANPELSGTYHFLADQDATARDRIALRLSRSVLLATQERVHKWFEDHQTKRQ